MATSGDPSAMPGTEQSLTRESPMLDLSDQDGLKSESFQPRVENQQPCSRNGSGQILRGVSS